MIKIKSIATQVEGDDGRELDTQIQLNITDEYRSVDEIVVYFAKDNQLGPMELYNILMLAAGRLATSQYELVDE